MSDEKENAKRDRKDFTGELFANEFKKAGDKQPAVRGFVKIEGREYRATGWTRYTQREGKKFLSLSFQPREEWERELNEARAKRAASENGSQENREATNSEDLPF